MLFDERLYAVFASGALFTVYYVVKAMLLSGNEALQFARQSWGLPGTPLEFELYRIDDPAWRDYIGYMEVERATKREALVYIRHANAFLQLGEKFFNPPSDSPSPIAE
jgi:hypothetical protein